MKSETVVYEVNVEADREIADEFRSWLSQHVSSIVALPGFQQAEIFVEEWDERTSPYKKWSVQYRVDSQHNLDQYLRDQAPGMRQEAIDRFGPRFRATRRVLLCDQLIAH